MFEEATLAAVVRRHVGPHAQVRRYGHENDATPTAIVLDSVRETLRHPFAVFWVDGGLPENYSLPSFTPAVVVFNSRYLQMTAYLLFMLTDDTITTDKLGEIAEKAFLEIMAELTLRYGDPAVAGYLVARLVTSGGHVYPLAPAQQDIASATIDERYMAVWFFALVHELGHVHIEHTDEADPVVTRPYLDWLVDTVMAAMLGDTYELARDALARGEGLRSLDRDLLTTEVRADMFAVDVLRTATQRVMQQTGTADGLSMHRFVAESLQMFSLFHHMNRCARVAALAANARPEAVADAAGSIAFNVRLNVLVDYLAATLAISDAAVNEVREAFLAMAQGDAQRMEAFDAGFIAAQAQCLNPAQRQDDVMLRLAERLADDPVAGWIVQRFCRLAESMKIDSPDLRLLADLANRPADAIDTLKQALKAFFIPWVAGPDMNEPFCVEAPDGQLIVTVYFTESDVDEFSDAFGYGLARHHRLERATVVSHTEHHAMLTIIRQLPEAKRDRAQVIFDGSPAYVRWLLSIVGQGQ
jgi:hypothetical protein